MRVLGFLSMRQLSGTKGASTSYITLSDHFRGIICFRGALDILGGILAINERAGYSGPGRAD